MHNLNKKAVLSQRWPRDAPYSLYGCSENFWESRATPTANFPDISNGPLFRSIPWLRTKFEVLTLLAPDIIVIGVLGGGCKVQSSERDHRRGSAMERFEKGLMTMSSHRHFIVTFPLSLRISEISYCRFCAPAHHFPQWLT